MIWVISGTEDGRILADKLQKELNQEILVSVVSDYGAKLIDNKKIEVMVGRFDFKNMIDIIKSKNVSKIIDASHPYAEVVTQTAIKACEKTGINYLRYERKVLPLPKYSKLYLVYNEDEAAKLAKKITINKTIFLTTGSKTLKTFTKHICLKEFKVYTRVLPSTDVMEICESAGFLPKYIIGMQGPFSYATNYLQFQESKADTIVMKNSGLIGGTDTKFKAAIDLDMDIIVIDRPQLPSNIDVAHSYEEALVWGRI